MGVAAAAASTARWGGCFSRSTSVLVGTPGKCRMSPRPWLDTGIPSMDEARVAKQHEMLKSMHADANEKQFEQARRTELRRQRDNRRDVQTRAAEADARMQEDMDDVEEAFNTSEESLRARWRAKREEAHAAFKKQIENLAGRRNATIARLQQECETTRPADARPSTNLLDLEKRVAALALAGDYRTGKKAREQARALRAAELERTNADHDAAYAVKQMRAHEQLDRERKAIEEKYNGRVLVELEKSERSELMALRRNHLSAIRKLHGGRTRERAELRVYENNAKIAGKIR